MRLFGDGLLQMLKQGRFPVDAVENDWLVWVIGGKNDGKGNSNGTEAVEPLLDFGGAIGEVGHEGDDSVGIDEFLGFLGVEGELLVDLTVGAPIGREVDKYGFAFGD